MAPERSSDAPSQPPLKLSPRRPRAVSGVDRYGGSSRGAGPRSVGRWTNDPYVLMLIALAFLASPGVVFVAKIPLDRRRHEGRRRSFLRSQPRRQEQDHVVRTDDTPGGNAVSYKFSVSSQQQRSGNAVLATPSPKLGPRGRANEDNLGRPGGDEGWDGESVAAVSKEPRNLRSSLIEKKIDASSHYEFGCKEIEAMLAGEKTLIGHGRTREVYLVEYGGRKLAVKALREDLEPTANRARGFDVHRWEAATLDTVIEHPNVVDLLGVCKSSSVSEVLPRGLDALVLRTGAEPLPISSVVSMALDAARGLQALHEAQGGAVVHSDIRPEHLMLDAQGRIKINNLDACTFIQRNEEINSYAFERRTAASTADPWRSPEDIAGERVSEKMDIYSMGLVFYSMLALKPPYDGDEEIISHVLDGIRPPIDPSWHPGFIALVEDMWQRDPKARPPARRVVERLEALGKETVVRTNVGR